MTDVAALAKHPCPTCGAQAEWNPGKQKLVCPYCGAESPYRYSTEIKPIEEIDLASTLRSLPENLKEVLSSKRAVQCQSCKAVTVFTAERVGQRCEFCGSPELVPYQDSGGTIRPQSLLPFKVPETQVRETMRRWYASKWFAPGRLKRKALVDTIKGVYVPYWTFDAKVRCPWQAEAGHYYYVNESYRDKDGRTQTRQVRKVRWEWAQGMLDHFFDDQPVPGTRGIHPDLLNAIEPWPTKELITYDTAFLSGFVVERYQVALDEAAMHSREAMHARLEELCAAEVPGDTYRNLRIEPDYSAETFKHILVPVWLLAYTYGRKAYQVLANGYTGKIDGEYPKSFWKIFFAVLLVLAIVGIVMMLEGR
jgi:hypothetical protein